jgi:hypothetical protein
MVIALTPYQTLRLAVLERRRVSAFYEGLPREFSPHCIGTGKGIPRVLGWQDGGLSKHHLPNWRCFDIAKLTSISFANGPWATGGKHTRPQVCITHVDVEVCG